MILETYKRIVEMFEDHRFRKVRLVVWTLHILWFKNIHTQRHQDKGGWVGWGLRKNVKENNVLNKGIF